MQHLNSHTFTSTLVSVAATTFLVGLSASLPAWGQNAPAAPAASSAPAKLGAHGEPVTLNFVNAEIEAVARAMASMTGRNVVVDPRVKGTMNLNTERAVSPAVAYNLFLATIRLQGFTVVEVGGLDKVVPEADAKLQGGSVSAGPVSTGSNNGQLMTQIFKLNFEPANNLVAVLRPLISPNNTINVNPGNNSLVITDYADNLQRLARIIAALDVANATDVEILTLKHALAADLAPLVLRLVESGGAGAPTGQADTSFKTTLVPEPRSNTLILRAANAARVAQVKLLVEKLDQPGPSGNGAAGNIYVVYLKNADATKLAVTLRAAISGEARTAAAAPASAVGAPGASQASTQPSTGGQIQADPSTNSLIITAPEPQYRQLRAVIDRLDARRAQVFVESLIIEVNDDKAAQFGVQWQDLLGNKGQNKVVVGTNYGTNGSTNIVGLAGTLAADQALGLSKVTTLPTAPAGLNLGYLKNINGMYVLSALANMLQSTGVGNVLSTPTLMTLDNEEAKITVGQNVPFVTGQYTNSSSTSSSGTVNPFTTTERKDVGLTLKVKPQISENGTIRMTISQEVSSIQASSINSVTGIITNKRLIETNVLVDDGSIVVLGGLLQDEYSANQDKVPGLGDVPLLGNLFKTESRSHNKTNLMVFLRPVVMRDASEVEQLSMGRYEKIRLEQGGGQPTPSTLIPVNEAPQLPALKPRILPPATPPAAANPAQ